MVHAQLMDILIKSNATATLPITSTNLTSIFGYLELSLVSQTRSKSL